MKHYEWNDCGVCTNPDTFGVPENPMYGLTTHYGNKISVAMAPDGTWRYGVWYQFDQDSAGGCHGTSLKYGEVFQSQREAVLAGVKYLQGIVKKQKETQQQCYVSVNDSEHFVKHPSTTIRMQECIELAFNQVSQTSLF